MFNIISREGLAMKEQNVVKISVRNLVEFVMMSGDIVTGFTSNSRLTEAIRAHQFVQESGGEEYKSEVSISGVFKRNEIIFDINGRIDGVIEKADCITIDEIKTTSRSLEDIQEDYSPVHWAQAKCYGYIYALQNNLQSINIQLTYFQIDSGEIKNFIKSFSLSRLEEFFYGLLDEYLRFAEKLLNWQISRNASIESLQFPFDTYRSGQRELAVAVYKTVKEGRSLFAQAPTGIGKTIATLFPTIKVLYEGEISKIFYLTAKTITRSVAEAAVNLMKEKGLRLKTLTITAKEKICPNDEVNCNPEYCEYARGHFDRVRDAILDILEEDIITRDVVERYSRKHMVCPFEFSLDVSNFCDLVICDYNYVFDPAASLKRYFLDGGGDYAFLVDEAHNLVDRGREMFSAELFKSQILELKKASKEYSKEVSKSLNDINSLMIKQRNLLKESSEGVLIEKEKPKELYKLLRSFIKGADKYLAKNQSGDFGKALLDFYFEAVAFVRTSEFYNEGYVTYYERHGNDLKVKVFCLDPSSLFKDILKRGRASVFFSATLNPMDYFMEVLGGDENSYRIKLKSPFPQENLCLLLEDRVSTRFKVRELTYERIADLIASSVRVKRGNYLIYFPSYQYMNRVYDIFKDKCTEIKTLVQRGDMKEEEREEFLSNFSEGNTESLAAFAVMGGIFSEGIDLAGDRLSGAVIVGVGLPQICLERDIIKNYFNDKKGLGFEYSYTYPGMNKVMQAVGRVIRTSSDRGVVILIDDRFSNNTYKRLFPPEWSHVKRVSSLGDITKYIDGFWNS